MSNAIVSGMTAEFCEETTAEICMENLKRLRQTLGENQTDFWHRFGVTQSRGSRFEKGVAMPASVAILLELYLEKKINDLDLMAAMQNSNRPIDTEKVRPLSGRNN